MDFQPKIAAPRLKRLELHRINGWRANSGFCGLGFAQGPWLRLVPTRAVPHAARGWREKRPGDSQASGALYWENWETQECAVSKLKMAGTQVIRESL
jgi:hypothetical protein